MMGRFIRRIPLGCLAAWLAAGAAIPTQAQQPPQGKRVELVARDGVRSVAFWFDGGDPGAPAALLLHDNGRDHFVWNPLVGLLQKAGMNVLALDLRGHGASERLAPEKHEQLVTRDAAVYRELLLDAQAGVAFLQRDAKTPSAKIAVVGAELGSSVGFALMASDPKLASLIVLTPLLYGYGYDTLADAKRLGKRPLLIYTTKDQFSEATEPITQALSKTGAVQVALFPDRTVRGTAMLGRQPSVERTIRNFLVSLFDLAP